jgi:hypothetical protein
MLTKGKTTEVTAFAEDSREALVEAHNLLSFETELKPGWTLSVEEDKWPLVPSV